MCAVASRSRSFSLSRVPGARRAPIPGFIAFCDPTQRDRPPDGGGWAYEIKADGYRAQLHLRPDDTKVYSRTGLDWTEEFGPIAAAAGRLKARSAVIDGEAVVYGGNGLPDFQQLRRELGKRQALKAILQAFLKISSPSASRCSTKTKVLGAFVSTPSRRAFLLSRGADRGEAAGCALPFGATGGMDQAEV